MRLTCIVRDVCLSSNVNSDNFEMCKSIFLRSSFSLFLFSYSRFLSVFFSFLVRRLFSESYELVCISLLNNFIKYLYYYL